ncbi:MAG: hypothetical protein KAJ19_26650 [Gammaproteobacteria bacterium]|nr:hypothetical protein [Gammaproteobacteria bacterium]
MEGEVKELNAEGLDLGKPNHKYFWIAEFEDGSVLRQFDKGGVEHHMGEVYEYPSRLLKFTFQRRRLAVLGGHQIIVDLMSGVITIDGREFLPYDGKNQIGDVEYRVEFWMRNYSTMEMFGTEQVSGAKNKTKYFVGWSTIIGARKINRFVCLGFDGKIGIG